MAARTGRSPAWDQVEAASAAGDTIYVLQSQGVLDGGIQLKDGQKLIGLGPKVNTANGNSARAMLTNTTDARYDGDAVRLAKNNVVENIHIDNTFRSAILGINAVAAQLRNNLMTNIMAVHDLFAIEGPAPSTCVPGNCVGEWPNGYILFASQTNHFGAITLVTCGPGARSAVTMQQSRCPADGLLQVPRSRRRHRAEHRQRRDLRQRDSGQQLRRDHDHRRPGCPGDGDGDRQRHQGSVAGSARSLWPSVSPTTSSDRAASRIIAIENTVSNLTINGMMASNLSPFGTFRRRWHRFPDRRVEPAVERHGDRCRHQQSAALGRYQQRRLD